MYDSQHFLSTPTVLPCYITAKFISGCPNSEAVTIGPHVPTLALSIQQHFAQSNGIPDQSCP
jgi:hypothetical protein